MDQGEKEMMTIHRHLDGPYEDVDTGEWFAVFLAEVDNEVCEIEVEFETFDDAYFVIKSLNEAPGPLEIHGNVTYH